MIQSSAEVISTQTDLETDSTGSEVNSSEVGTKKAKKKPSLKEINQQLQHKLDQAEAKFNSYAYALAGTQNNIKFLQKTKAMELCSVYKDFCLELIELEENIHGEDTGSNYFKELLLRRKIYQPSYDNFDPSVHTLLAGSPGEGTLKVHRKGYFFDYKEDKGILLRKAIVTFEVSSTK